MAKIVGIAAGKVKATISAARRRRVALWSDFARNQRQAPERHE
jgi:hypothetical protein